MDWRATLTTKSRQDVIQKLIEVVKLAAPSQDQTKLAELASVTEQSIFEKATSRQEYILLLQQKISNLQAKIAVIQKNQVSSSLGNYGNQAFTNPVIAPKYPIGQIGSQQMGQTGNNVPHNLRNMVLNLQQQQAQNMNNSIKNQLAANHVMQAAKIAQKTLIGVQLQASKNSSLQAVQTPLQPSNGGAQALKSSMVQPAIPAVQTGSPSQNPVSFPSLNLSEAQKADVTEKLKKIMPIYQKIDLIINYLSASEAPAKNNIQKLLQLKKILTEQFKNLKKSIFLSAEGLDNIYEFLVKMLQAAEEIRSSKISTPIQSIQTPTNTVKPENISNPFKYGQDQELYLKKSNRAKPLPIITPDKNWTGELKMYGIDSDRTMSDKSSLELVFEDCEYLFGSLAREEKPSNEFRATLESEICRLESLGFTITRLPDFQTLQVFLVKNNLSNWTIVVHLQNSLVKEWQLLERPTHDYSDKNSFSLDKSLLEGKSLEMVQFLRFS